MTASQSESGETTNRPVKRFPFLTSMRLRKSPEFAAVFDRKVRASNQHLLLFGRRRQLPDLDDSTTAALGQSAASSVASNSASNRYGLSVSKKHGNAVKRNRIKRLLREAIRSIHPNLPEQLDIVVIPRVNSGATLDDYRQSLKQLVKKLSRKLADG